MNAAGVAAAMVPRRVAFGQFDLWEAAIRRNLDARYTPFFVDLDRFDPREFEAVLPLQLRHYPPLERQSELRGARFFHPSRRVVSLCDDKLKLAQFLVAHGFGEFVPPIRSAGAPYPYVWKKRQSWWGVGCHIVKGPVDERELDLNDGEYFAQEVVAGEIEFATHILRAGGEIRYASTFLHKMSKSLFVNGAQDSPVHSTFLRGCPYLEIFSEILAKLEFEGTACFDYKVVAGRPLLFEINPRVGGTLCSDITAYVDAYLGSLTALPPEPGLLAKLGRLPRELFARLRSL